MSNALGCLLRRALAIIPDVEFEYRILKGRVTNDIGNLVASYGAWTKSRGNVQPGLAQSFNGRGVSEIGMIMKALGLDQTKKIMTVYAHGIEGLRNVHDQDMPDQIRYHGLVYNIWSVSDWFDYDGWKVLICVEDTREREPVTYKTVLAPGEMDFIRNPMPFAVEIDYGSKNDELTKMVDGAMRTYRYNGATNRWWYATWDDKGRVVNLENPVLEPGECATMRSPSGITIVWGTD